jgi:S-adenosylmethionine-dependent methyltransferase
MRKEKKLEQFYDSLSSHYERMHKKRFCDKILEYFTLFYLPKRKLKILDAGGGVGRFAIPLAKQGHSVVLSDISQGMLDNANKLADKQKLKIDYIKESVVDLSKHLSSSFDVVLVMNAILDYCGDYEKALGEINRVLKKNGLLIGTVNNRFVYSASHELKKGNIGLFNKSMASGDRYISWGGAKGHWTHEFTLDELKTSLKDSSFEIINLLGVFNLLGKYADVSTFSKIKQMKLFELQIEYAKKEEYLNNSTDFFFVAKKSSESQQL